MSHEEDRRYMTHVMPNANLPRQLYSVSLASLLLMTVIFGGATTYATEPQTIHYNNGDKYVGETLNGERHGQGTYTFHDGKHYVGAWRNGQRYGQGTLTFPNGDVYMGEFANGTFHGHGISIVQRAFCATGSQAMSMPLFVAANAARISAR